MVSKKNMKKKRESLARNNYGLETEIEHENRINAILICYFMAKSHRYYGVPFGILLMLYQLPDQYL
jgi:hypothetical protein